MEQERDLIIRLRKGDKESFNIIFDNWYPLFISFTRRMLRNDAVCEDIVQNVFMRLWIHREHIDPNRSLKNYLLVSVRNEIYCHLRLVFNARRENLSEDHYEYQDKTDVAEEYSAKDFQKNIDSIVRNMPTKRKEVFELSRKEHLSNEDIAKKLGISVRTVEKHLQLALSEIRKSLKISIVVLIMLLW